MKKTRVITEAFALMIVLQAIKILFETAVKPVIPDTTFSHRMSTAFIMAVLALFVFLYAKLRKTPLSLFPEKFGKAYIIFTCISAALLISSPSNFTGGYRAVMLALYGSIVTPVYEEFIFRGYLWNRLKTVFSKEIYVYLWSILLFSVWHLGYMIEEIAAGSFTPVLWKLAAGVGYGAVLGLLRLKTKNCYSTILLHGVLNIFMI